MSLKVAPVPGVQAHLRALAHPLRLRMLSLLAVAPASAAELARELGRTQADASSHLRTLEAAGLVEVDAERTVRGRRERRYRVTPLLVHSGPDGLNDADQDGTWPAALHRRWSERDTGPAGPGEVSRKRGRRHECSLGERSGSA